MIGSGGVAELSVGFRYIAKLLGQLGLSITQQRLIGLLTRESIRTTSLSLLPVKNPIRAPRGPLNQVCSLAPHFCPAYQRIASYCVENERDAELIRGLFCDL